MIYVITGQTATGKTKLALELAQKCDGELVNCDSRQIYKGLDIITGKDLPENSKFKIQKRINNFDIGYYSLESEIYHLGSRLWLYDIVSPKQYFSSYDWVQCAHTVIEDIHGRGKTPIIVGGTYLYIKHLLYGFATENIPPDWKLRRELENKSISQLQTALKTLASKIFQNLNQSDRNNPHRLMRKIEIARSSSYFPYSPLSRPYQITPKEKLNLKKVYIQCIGLRFKNKEKLRQQIIKRVKEGAVEEVKQLLKKGYSESDPGLKTIGYHQLFNYLNNQSTLEEAVNIWITKELQYAKRQYTFMKKDPNIIWSQID